MITRPHSQPFRLNLLCDTSSPKRAKIRIYLQKQIKTNYEF